MSHHRKFLRSLALISLAAVPAIAAAQRQSALPDPRAIALLQAPMPLAEFSLSALTLRDSLVAFARAQIGRRYRIGGATPERGFDCSGLVKYVLASFKVDVPRTSRAQARIGEPLSRDPAELRPGDLLLFGRAKAGVSHVGIYTGNGRFIHASSIAGRVIESRLDRPPSALIKPLKSARRVVSERNLVLLALRGE